MCTKSFYSFINIISFYSFIICIHLNLEFRYHGFQVDSLNLRIYHINSSISTGLVMFNTRSGRHRLSGEESLQDEHLRWTVL